MALSLPWLLAAVVSAIGPASFSSTAPLVDTVVNRAVDITARSLAGRRGFRFARPIPVRVVDSSRMRSALEASLRAARSVDEARNEDALYQLLGLRSEQERRGAPSVEVSGLYDVQHGQVLVGNWIDLESARFALTRNVAEALLDRRFGLKRLLAGLATLPIGEADSDAFLARQAFAEGDATVQALEGIDPRGDPPPPRMLAEIIEHVRLAIFAENAGVSPLDVGRRLFVELDGLTFVAQMRGRVAWNAVDGVWAHPPRSTEQILHPEKYQRQEMPDDVGSRLPTRPQPGWRTSYRDTLGELGTRLFLARAVDEARAQRAASGWAGDRAMLLQGPDSNVCAAWITTWDDDTDAEDFATEVTSVLARLAQVAAPDARPGTARFELRDGTGTHYVVERRHRTVGMLFAAPIEADAVLSKLMAAAALKGGPPPARSRQGRPRSR
jgi:hypothetical protein